MEGGTGDANNLGPLGPADKSDLNALLNTYRSTTSPPTDDWWRTNLNVLNYWSYQAIAQAIHHYDICYDKNYFYYRNPETGLWSVHSWDLDLTRANNMFDSGCGGVEDLYRPVFGGGGYPARPALSLEYRNRVREIRDLLFNTDQAGQLIDDNARLLRGTTPARHSCTPTGACGTTTRRWTNPPTPAPPARRGRAGSISGRRKADAKRVFTRPGVGILPKTTVSADTAPQGTSGGAAQD